VDKSRQAVVHHSSLPTGAPTSAVLDLSIAQAEPWYVSYTRPRHEKRVAQQLAEQGIGCFLPLYCSVRRWKDRRKVLDLPLFPGYVFVQVNGQNRLSLLRLPGVLGLICVQGKPALVPSAEIRSLQQGLGSGNQVRPHPYLQAGRKVRIRSGSLAGVEGLFVRRRDSARVVLSISLIQRSVSVEIDEADVEPVS
jgi:transcription antitermination factor NusG